MSMIKIVRVLTGTAVVAGAVLAIKALGDKLEEMEKQARKDAQKKFDEDYGEDVAKKTDITENANKVNVEKEENEKLQSKVIDIKEAQSISKAKVAAKEEKSVEDKSVKPIKETVKTPAVKKTVATKNASAEDKPKRVRATKPKEPKVESEK